MKLIKFDGTVGVMSADAKGKTAYLLIKEGIGTGIPGEKIKHDYCKKGSKVDTNKFDVIFMFRYRKSIDVVIKALKDAKKSLKE